MTHFIGIDVGTYSAKGVLVGETGRVLAQASHAHEMAVPRPGWAEHRPEADWWAGITDIVPRLLSEAGVDAADVAGLALSGIGPCLVPVDDAGEALCDAILYGVDIRAAAEVAEMTDQIGIETLLEVGGNPLTSQSVGPKIGWLKRNRPEIYAQASGFVTATTWLVERLTGARVIDHYTAAGFAPLYDIRACDWTSELAPDLAGRDRLPRLLWSGEVAGRVTEAAAEATGLAPGTPVTAGTIDAAAEALSVGVARPGDMMLMYGSTVFIVTLTEAPLADARLWSAPWLFQGEWASMAGQATSGTLTHWFRDRFAQELEGEAAFAALAEEAGRSPPGAKGLLLLPYFSGERTPIHDPKARGALFGLDLTHGRGDVYRAFLEGIAYGTRHSVEAMGEAGQRPQRVLAVGGGTQNAVWMQASSDITGLEQIVPRATIGASLGDAFLAALATGHAERGDIASWNPEARRVSPARHDAYERGYPLFRALYEQTSDIAHALAEQETPT